MYIGAALVDVHSSEQMHTCPLVILVVNISWALASTAVLYHLLFPLMQVMWLCEVWGAMSDLALARSQQIKRQRDSAKKQK